MLSAQAEETRDADFSRTDVSRADCAAASASGLRAAERCASELHASELHPSELCVGGVTPFTSIDYPGKLAAVVFVQGCPWRCIYCHNPHLQSRSHSQEGPVWADVRAWLARRVGLIDAVVFSGGEPTTDPALSGALRDARALGLLVGLHTAGIYPRRLQALLPAVDWVGLDVKAPLGQAASHERITGLRGSAEAVRQSLHAVLASGVPFEVRTTAHPDLLSDADLLQLGQDLAGLGVQHYAVQRFRRTGQPNSPLRTTPLDYPSLATVAQLQALFPHFTLRED